MREGPNFAPTGVVPVSAFPIKSTIKVALACTVFDFDVDNVKPDIPIAERAIIEPSIGGVVNIQNVDGDQFMKERTG